MEKIKVVHDTIGHTLTIWFDDPVKEQICEETTDEIVLIKDASGRVIGFELLNYYPQGIEQGFAVETLIQTGPSELPHN